MYFSDLMRGLLRRWYVLLAGFALTGCAAFSVFGQVPVRAEAEATMVLLPPAASVEELEGSNPYLVLGGLGQALAVLTTRLGSQEVQERLVSDDDVAYAVVGDTSAGAAFLTITTEAATEANTLGLLEDVRVAAEQQLAHMQEELGVTAESAIGIILVAADVEATPLTSTRMQLTVAVGGAGAVLTVVLAAAVEGLAAARSRRRAAGQVPEAAPDRDPLEPVPAARALYQDGIVPPGPRKGRGGRRPSRERKPAEEAPREPEPPAAALSHELQR